MQKNTWQNALNESVSKVLNKELTDCIYGTLSNHNCVVL